MKVRCPHCGARLKVDDRALGRTGPCPSCKGSVLMVPIEEAASTSAASPEPVHAGARQSSGAFEEAGAGGYAPEPASPLGSGGLVIPPPPSGDGPFVIPTQADGGAYDVEAADDPLPPPPVIPRAGLAEPPKKSKRARARELEDLRSEGNRFLLQIRLLLLGLGVLMLAYNAWAYSNIESFVSDFKQAMTSSPNIKVDPAKLEEVCKSLATALRIECGLYFVLGLAFCVLAVIIHIAPLIATWAALGTYVAAWIIDLLLIEAIFGGIAAGQSLYSLGTVIKVGIIAGLWYGVQVGQAYEEQVVRPMRELKQEEDE